MCLVSYIEFRPFCHRWGKNNNSASYITWWNDILKSLDFGMGWEAEAFFPTIKWLLNQYVFNWKPQQKEQTSVTTFSRVLLKRMKASIKSLASSASLFLQHAKKVTHSLNHVFRKISFNMITIYTLSINE